MSQSIVLCEGFHDRAFWKGWLRCLGCTDPGAPPPGKTGRIGIKDPWKKSVTGGQYAFLSASKEFIRVVPCHGRTEILPTANFYLKDRITAPIRRLVINIDSDSAASGKTTAKGLKRSDVQAFATRFDPAAAPNADGEIEIDGGATKLSLIRWETADPPAPGLPDQHTLERVVSSALAAVYPARAASVQTWLDGRPGMPPADPKEHAWSYMAGWYAGFGCETFYSNLWEDSALVDELRSRLTSYGAWQISQRLAQ